MAQVTMLPQRSTMAGTLGKGVGNFVQNFAMARMRHNAELREREQRDRERQQRLSEKTADREFALQLAGYSQKQEGQPSAQGDVTLRNGKSYKQFAPNIITMSGTDYVQTAPGKFDKLKEGAKLVYEDINGRKVPFIEHNGKLTQVTQPKKNFKTYVTPKGIKNIDVNKVNPKDGWKPYTAQGTANGGITPSEQRQRAKERGVLERNIISDKISFPEKQIASKNYHTLLPDDAKEVYITAPGKVINWGRDIKPSMKKVKLPVQDGHQITMKDIRFSAKNKTVEEVLKALFEAR